MFSEPGMRPRCFALVPCAGTGSRSGGELPKQYQRVAGQSVVSHTLAALSAVPRIEATLVVLAPDDGHFDELLSGFEGERGWVLRNGGATRAATVQAGLVALRERGVAAHDWVLVHDAARCLVRSAWIQRLIDACDDDEVGGLLATPLADTLKVGVSGRVASTVPRSDKWAAQTPQMFRLGLLERALNHAGSAGAAVTDEASAVELMGHAPLLVPGDWENFKLTWPGDFDLARRLLQTRETR
jgi:2-C-methyl-D-erythritol 4-phosphate cytidylyltransferase